MKSVGVMQGRLVPPVGGKIQAFPADNWELEFWRAKEIGLHSIEWIIESPLDRNPLLSSDGLLRIRNLINLTGVKVEFICADYFMECPLVRMSPVMRESNKVALDRIIAAAHELEVVGIEIPFVDASEIRGPEEEDELCSILDLSMTLASNANIRLGLETSLPPERFRRLLSRLDPQVVFANYDTGNSASLGYSPVEEMDAYGDRIANVHLKDRMLHGTTVPFGMGSADIPLVLSLLRSREYRGDFVLQVARGHEGDELATVAAYARQARAWIAKAFESSMDSQETSYGS